MFAVCCLAFVYLFIGLFADLVDGLVEGVGVFNGTNLDGGEGDWFGAQAS